MPESKRPHRLIAVEDVLRVLDAAGPLSIDAIARRLELDQLEARMVLLHAHWHGLVRANRGGEWTISERGRDVLVGQVGRRSLATSVRGLRAAAAAEAWRRRLRPAYIARGGLPLALGAVVCVAGVAVASSSLPTGGPPSLPAPHVKRIRHHRHRHVRLERRTLYRTTVITTQHRLERSGLTVTVTRVPSVQQQLVGQHRRTLATGCVKRQTTTVPRRGSSRHARTTTTRRRSVQRC